VTRRIAVLDHDIGGPPPELPRDYPLAHCLLRAGGEPLADVIVPATIRDGRRVADPARLLPRRHAAALARRLVRRALDTGLPASIEALDTTLAFAPQPPAAPAAGWPLVTVAVCTRDRPELLAGCLDALARLDYPRYEVLVVDNAPSGNATLELTAGRAVRYVREPRPGLDWARNCALAGARGEIVAYTDDDARADPHWLQALLAPLLDNADVGVVTGLVLAEELDTEAQQLFERYGGFGRGFRRRWARYDSAQPEHWRLLGTGQFGTGANLAIRRRTALELGGFDPALDVGTATDGGGDLEMMFRALREGWILAYEPRALVRHRHRRDYAGLARQIAANGTGFRAYLERCRRAYAEDRRAVRQLARWWLWHWQLPRLMRAVVDPGWFPPRLLGAELVAFVRGGRRWQVARKDASCLAGDEALAPLRPPPRSVGRRNPPPARAVRMVDVAAGLAPLEGVEAYGEVEVWVRHGRHLLGHLRIRNHYTPVGVLELGDRIAEHFGARLLDPARRHADRELRQLVAARLDGSSNAGRRPGGELAADVSASIVVATLDRAEALARCLAALHAQEARRRVEIVVVDNNPDSGLTPAVVAAFPAVRLVREPRRGLSWARNAGIRAATGEIIVTTDDDVTMPPDWLEKLLEPFADGLVMAVTGNVLPESLDSEAEVLFERYGGLGRGAVPLSADRAWMNRFRRRAVPTWHLGATANAAFRAEVFRDPAIGLFDAALGAGTPTGCSEDTDLFYRILSAGGVIRYHPDAWVRHRHRDSRAALRSQIYAYSKGHVAYHLVIARRHGDLRSLWRVFVELPGWHMRQVWRAFRAHLGRRRPRWPLSLVAIEMAGNLAGPFALLRARRRARRQGQTAPPVVGDAASEGGG